MPRKLTQTNKKPSVFDEQEQIEEGMNKTQDTNVSEKHNQSTQASDTSNNYKKEMEGTNRRDNDNTQVEEESTTFVQQFRTEVKKKQTMEDTHKKDTFYVEKELLQRLNKLCKKNPRGFKTAFINHAIRTALEENEG